MKISPADPVLIASMAALSERPDDTEIEISVVVPLYYEEDSVGPLLNTLTDAMVELGRPYEILLVDDGSRDETFPRAAAIARDDPRIRIIKFRRNCGQTMAMVAGIDHARGHIIITMDGDLQNDPRDIPAFIAKIEEGYDLVAGWRHKRQDDLIRRKLPSWIANWLIGKVTGVAIKDNGCSLKAYRAEIIKNIPLYSEMHRFIPAMASLSGARIAQIKVRHHARTFGKSKYGLSRIYKVVLDLVCVQALHLAMARPLLWAGALAGFAVTVAMAFMAVAVTHLYGDTGTSATIFLAVAMLWGIMALFTLCCGIVADLAIFASGSRHDFLPGLTVRLIEPERTGDQGE